MIAGAFSKPDAQCNEGCKQSHLREFERKHGQDAGNELGMRPHFASCCGQGCRSSYLNNK